MAKGKGKGKGRGHRSFGYETSGYESSTGYETSGYESSTGYETSSYESSTGYETSSYESSTGYETSDYESLTTYETTDFETTGFEVNDPVSRSTRRRRCAGDTVNLRFNPTNDAVNSVFVAGSILPCSLPPTTPPGSPPTPIPTPAATSFISCLEANGFTIIEIVPLTPTDVLVTLVRC